MGKRVWINLGVTSALVAVHYRSVVRKAPAEGGQVAEGDTVVVVGGGLAGTLQAYELAQRGFSVRVVEARPQGGAARPTTLLSTDPKVRPLPPPSFFSLWGNPNPLPTKPFTFNPMWPVVEEPGLALTMMQFCSVSSDVLHGTYFYEAALQGTLAAAAQLLSDAPGDLARLMQEVPGIPTPCAVERLTVTRGAVAGATPAGLEGRLPRPLGSVVTGKEAERVDPLLKVLPVLEVKTIASRGLVSGEGVPVALAVDTEAFLEAVRSACKERGVAFSHGFRADSVVAEEGGYRIRSVSGEEYNASAVVLCCGADGRRLARSAGGSSVPIIPVKTHSIALKLADIQCGMEDNRAVWDREAGVEIMRTGDNVLLRGQMQVTANSQGSPSNRLQREFRAYARNSLGVKDTVVMRPVPESLSLTPDSCPLLGAVGGKVFINDGHAELGLGTAIGGSRLVADLMCDPTLASSSSDAPLACLAPTRYNFL